MYFVKALIPLFCVLLSIVRSENENDPCVDIEKFEYAFKVVQTLTDHESKIKLLEAKIEELEEKAIKQDGRIADLKTDLRGVYKKVEVLNETVALSTTNPSGKETFVGFTAYLTRDATNLPIGRPIVFHGTLLNVGEGYSTVNGKFTVPVSGYYLFTVVIESKNSGSCVIRLVVDGANTLDVVVEPYHIEQNLHGVNAGVLSLRVGQQVWIEPYQVNTPFLEGTDYYRFTTFSGALLHSH